MPNADIPQDVAGMVVLAILTAHGMDEKISHDDFSDLFS